MTPEEEVVRAGHANEILENELFKEAFETVENAYLSGIRSAGFTDSLTREKFALRYACLHDVLIALRSVLETGEMAKKQLSFLQRAKKAVNFS